MARLLGRKRRHDPWPRARGGLILWGRDHLRTASETMHFVSTRLGTSLVVWLLVGIALALPAGLLLLQFNLAHVTQAWDGRPGLSVYFSLDASDPAVEQVVGALREHEAIDHVKVTTAAEALAQFQDHSGLTDALELLSENPLPVSLRAVVVNGANVEDLQAAASIIAGNPGVVDVVLEKTWMERVIDVSRVVSRLGILLGVLFGIGAILVTATSVRLTIEARLEELRVLMLVGATDAQIRRPFLYFGAVYGVGGGLFAAMLISLCLVLIESPLASLLGSYGEHLETAGFDPIFLMGLLCVGGSLGVAGALLAARQRLLGLQVL